MDSLSWTKNSSGRTVLVYADEEVLQNIVESKGQSPRGKNWVPYALWFRKWAGKSWPLVGRSNYEVMAKHFSSRVCLAPSVDRPAAFGVCWHRASLTLMTHCCLHRLSCHPAGSVESDLFKNWRQAACQCVPLRRGRQNHIFKCLFGLTYVRIHFNGLIWQSGFAGNKMIKQKPLVMITISRLYNFQQYMSRWRGERNLRNNYTVFLVMKKKHT